MEKDRRTALGWLAAAGAACAGVFALGGARAGAGGRPPAEAGWILSDEQWKAKLSPERYEILRGSGTERPFTSPLLGEHRAGVFSCAGCGLAAFSSKTKFDSGTGWPSFWEPLPGAAAETRDTALGMVRREIHCRRCAGHWGHVFEDGPSPTGLRYCMDGLALSFEPKAL